MRASYIADSSAASSPIGLRATPPVVPEWTSLAPVWSAIVNPMEPRSPYEIDGCPAAVQMVSDTTTDSVAKAGRPPARSPAMAAASPVEKFGLPISSSSSQRNWMLARTPVSIASRAP